MTSQKEKRGRIKFSAPESNLFILISRSKPLASAGGGGNRHSGKQPAHVGRPTSSYRRPTTSSATHGRWRRYRPPNRNFTTGRTRTCANRRGCRRISSKRPATRPPKPSRGSSPGGNRASGRRNRTSRRSRFATTSEVPRSTRVTCRSRP